MGFKFPKSCENAIVEEMSSAAKDVFSSVFDGKAFKNPLGDAMGKAGNLLSGDLGLDEFGLPIPNMLDNLDSLIADASGGQKDALENMKTQLFGSIPGTPGLPDVAGGLMGQLDSLKSHTDMLSGVGDLDAFTERLGMAGSLDGAMQRLGKGEGAFGNMFQSIENVGGMMNDVQGKLDSVKGMLDGGLDNINMGDLAAGAMSMGGLGDKLMGQIDLDNSVFNSAKNLVQKMGIADMISTNNCYIKEMMDGAIGTPNLKENLPAVLEEKFGPEFDENQQQAVEQVEEISKEEIKASGVHDDVLASVVGSNIVKTEEDIKKFAGRPVFDSLNYGRRNIDNFSPAESMIFGNAGRTEGSPHWEENLKGADGKEGVWIQWWSHFLGSRIGGGGMDEVDEKNTLIVQIFMWNTKLNTWTSKKINKDTWISGDAAQYMGRGGHELRKQLWEKTMGVYDFDTKEWKGGVAGVELADGYMIIDVTKQDRFRTKLFNPVL
jgi:hypothetical protein